MTDALPAVTTALSDRYRIEREIGEGGMATVYLADDLKHDRKVALKVLKPELAAVVGADRFLAEIKTTANLQHPHILPLFDSGEADGFLFYVMPYVEGESLREKLDREGELPVEEAVRIATAVAGALDYAHRNDVIHRDIKPANILIHDGQPIVADFGIALALSAAGGGRLTETGLSLGTPYYMSPEQATADRDPDSRSDAYSLGCVLYEMLVGEPPFTGSSAQVVLGKVLTIDPVPPTEHRTTIPVHVEAAVLKALEKRPADRFGSLSALNRALEDPHFRFRQASPESGKGLTSKPSVRRVAFVGWAVAICLGAFSAWLIGKQGPLASVLRYPLVFPSGEELVGTRIRLALSPDGTQLAYLGPGDHGEAKLWLRSRNALHGTPLSGTDGAVSPFFSPDGTQLGFLSDGDVKVMPVSGGVPTTLGSTVTGRRGAAWSTDGFIYVSPFSPQALMRVRETDGEVAQFTRLDSISGETDHAWPEALPKGKGVLFTVAHGPDAALSEIAVAATESGEHLVLFPGVFARYAQTGHLVYVTSSGVLMAVPFNERSLTVTGEHRVLFDGLRPIQRGGNVDFAISSSGTLIYGRDGPDDSQTPTPSPTRDVIWVSRDGTIDEREVGWTTGATDLALSPDGLQLAVTIVDGDETQVWVRGPDRPAFQLTLSGVENRRPAWASNDRVTFVSSRDGYRNLYQRRSDGTGTATLAWDSEGEETGVTYSPDGAWLVYRVGVGFETNLSAAEVGVDTLPRPLVATDHFDGQPRVSPDGRWLAYVVTTTDGEQDVFVAPFPDPTLGGPWEVSKGGGNQPAWAHSGSELFYRSANDELMAVEVLPGRRFATGRREVLFPIPQILANPWDYKYDVAPDDRSFVMVRETGSEAGGELVVVENFFEELKRGGPNR